MKLPIFCGVMILILSSLKANTVGVIYALEEDAKTLKAQGIVTTPIPLRSLGIEEVTIGPHKVYLVKAGSGNIPSALSTQNLVSKTNPELLISIGPAGDIGGNYPLGHISYITACAPYQQGAFTTSGFHPKDKITIEVPEEAKPLIQNAQPAEIAAGDIFIASSSQRDVLARETTCQLVDMNTAGILTARKSIPLLVLRIVSDHADDSAETDFKEFISSYKGNLGTQVATFLLGLPASPKHAASHPNIRSALD